MQPEDSHPWDVMIQVLSLTERCGAMALEKGSVGTDTLAELVTHLIKRSVAVHSCQQRTHEDAIVDNYGVSVWQKRYLRNFRYSHKEIIYFTKGETQPSKLLTVKRNVLFKMSLYPAVDPQLDERLFRLESQPLWFYSADRPSRRHGHLEKLSPPQGNVFKRKRHLQDQRTPAV